jgi:tetratricopeptide (TPR) repeat protein
LGNEAFAAQQFDQAIQYYAQAIKKQPNNHVYFSNRSASYAGLELWELATEDAKECIRLDPSFVKGYYRLAVAQIAQGLYDAALATIRQGLQVDNNNPQLMKQMRLVQQQKKVALAKQQSSTALAAASNGDGMTTTLDPQVATELRELQNQYAHRSREYNLLQADKVKAQRESKMAEITSQELQNLPGELSNCYRAMGKVFVRTSKQKMMQRLQDRVTTEQTKEQELTQKLEYMERQMASLTQNMNELIPSPSNQ